MARREIDRLFYGGLTVLTIGMATIAMIGCSSPPPKPQPTSSIADDIYLRSLNQRLHEENMENIRQQGRLERAIQTQKFNSIMRSKY